MKKKDPTSHRIIEKRRRDRMNNCLADLSKLIPGHYVKKGRGRVEKTEIIEMAIRHIRDLMAVVDAANQQQPIETQQEQQLLVQQHHNKQQTHNNLQPQQLLPTIQLAHPRCGCPEAQQVSFTVGESQAGSYLRMAELDRASAPPSSTSCSPQSSSSSSSFSSISSSSSSSSSSSPSSAEESPSCLNYSSSTSSSSSSPSSSTPCPNSMSKHNPSAWYKKAWLMRSSSRSLSR